MTVLTIFTTLVEKNYIMFAVQKDEAGVVSILILIIIVIIKYYCCTEGPNRATKEFIKKAWGSFAKCCWGWNLECLLCCEINFLSCFIMLAALSPKHEPYILCTHISSNNSCPVINRHPWAIAPLWQKYLNSGRHRIITPPPHPSEHPLFVLFPPCQVKSWHLK